MLKRESADRDVKVEVRETPQKINRPQKYTLVLLSDSWKNEAESLS